MRAAGGEVYQALLAQGPDEDLLNDLEVCNGYTKKFTTMKFRYEESFGTDVGKVAKDQLSVSESNREGSTINPQDRRKF